MDKNQEYELNEYEEDHKNLVTTGVVESVPQKPIINNLVKAGVAALIIAAFVLLLAVLVLQIIDTTQSDTACSCNCAATGPNTGSLTSPTTSTSNGPNCSVVYNNWTDDIQNRMMILQSKVNKLVNTSETTAWKIDDIRSFTDSQTETSINNTRDIDKILETTGNSTQKLMNIVNTLSNHRDTSTSTAGVVDEILLVVQELLVLHNDTMTFPTSCKQIKEQQPNSPSGVYLLATADGTASTYHTYCNMDTLCGSGGGWTRLAYLDMTDATQNCPPEFHYYIGSGVRTCGKQSVSGSSCESKLFSSNGISYTQVCGKAVGYQFGTPDGVNPHLNDINLVYMDGVSITRGSPRQHIWSLMVGVHAHKQYGDNCPCAGGTPLPAFVGNNYFCESGNPTDSWAVVFYPNDPLWDGQGCDAAEAGCCSDPRLPWFNRTLAEPTTDFLEMRICTNEGTQNEDIKLSNYEIYVK